MDTYQQARTPQSAADFEHRWALSQGALSRLTQTSSQRLLSKDPSTAFPPPPVALRSPMARAAQLRVQGKVNEEPLGGAARIYGRSGRLKTQGLKSSIPPKVEHERSRRKLIHPLAEISKRRQQQQRSASVASPADPLTTHAVRPRQVTQTLSPSEERSAFLRAGLGERGGWWANELVDLVDPVTPWFDFLHRRDKDEPFEVEDVFLLAGGIPGFGKPVSKIVKKGYRYLFPKAKKKRFLPTGKKQQFFQKQKKADPGLPEPVTKGSDRREHYPGVVSWGGKLPDIKPGDRWLRGSNANAAKVPLQVAKRLAGRHYSSFGAFRTAFWKEVARDPILSKQFGIGDRRRMHLRGSAPEVVFDERLKKSKSYELDHSVPLASDGNVYDLNNLIIRSPLNHRVGNPSAKQKSMKKKSKSKNQQKGKLQKNSVVFCRSRPKAER